MAPMFPVAAAGLSPLFQRAAQVVEVWEGPYMFLHVGGGDILNTSGHNVSLCHVCSSSTQHAFR